MATRSAPSARSNNPAERIESDDAPYAAFRPTRPPGAAETKGWELTPEAVDFHRTAYDDVEDPQIRRFLPGLRERLGRAR
ncbi:hypothetical protein [Streptomyces sp. NPDC013171]|uniref:hypothetical protein n=1 Tax=Streptomyces sp. NPDC013171 TaxID=3364863 RepID=UPI0036A1D8FF